MIRILIADDEHMEREMLQGMVQKSFGAEADTRLAVSGRQAVELAFLWDAELILMDIEMPGMNGLEAARQILDRKPDCKVIFITAYSLFSYAHEAVKLGACDYILKPVNPKEVEQAIYRACVQLESRKQLEQEAADDSDETENGDALMNKVKQYLKCNYMLYDISLDSVSRIVNMAPAYFSSRFKKCFGVNFVDYVAELRMNAAQELLKDPLRSTSEIATMVGYDSANYFTRAFKKHLGVTPTDYRRRCAGRKVEEP